MQSLSLPRPKPLPSAPFGQPTGPEVGLAKLIPKFSPDRSGQHGYPSPPMSEPHSPSQRPARSVESERLQYPPVSAPHRLEPGLPLPPPSSALFNPRQPLASQSNLQQRPLYPGGHHSQHQHHYQPGPAAERPPYGAPPAPQSYGYGYSPAGASPYILGAQQAGPQTQPAAMIAPPPTRPAKPARRTKAHVASACVNCKKAHLSCDVQRPCGRCVASGKQDTCKDVLHKKRGRPRLRDDRDFNRPEQARQQPEQTLGSNPPPSTKVFGHQAPYAASHSHRVAEMPRTMVAHTGNNTPNAGASSTAGRTLSVGSYGGVSSHYGVGPDLAYQSLPVAFLNLDLVIQKSNQAFQDLTSFLGSVGGKDLGELLEPRQHEALQRLRGELREERDEREPAYMAPITPLGHDPMRSVMESVVDRDVERVSHGFTDRPMFLSYRLPNGQYQSLQTQIRLAKTSLYFVTLVVRTPLSKPLGPPLLAQQLAPPTPVHASQSGSVPTPHSSRTGHYTPQQARPPSSASSAPNSPYSFNFSSVRTSLPSFSPSSYASSPSYGYSPTAGPETGYFPTYHHPQPVAHAPPYAPAPRTGSVTSEPLRELNHATRMEGLQLPPIRTGPAPLGSPLHLATSHSAPDGDRERVRRRESSSSADKRSDTPGEAGKRRRLNIREVLE
ncbi:hypothetical protein C7974DRAFT_320332 [Boeremia exigua]|uniref:uncharacterized protein n=1 Tax=Boeremia exigua TaxID=749465 RepID=UPI001E8EE1FC|nr:uncharacterized protein C7974DRAFT_320332 [Boeremia exigua]KAH6614987.1 hypothetical protein C7974DRAFT_320332 [Boeremia exigua]